MIVIERDGKTIVITGWRARVIGAVAGRRGKSSQNENSFVDDIAKKTGKGRSTIARKAARAKVVVLPEITGTSLDKGAEIDARV
jgi:hypothetical protein